MLKLRILFIAETYPPDYGGGAAIYIRDICRALARRGHQLRVLCTENKDHEPYTTHTDYDGPVQVERINLPYFKNKDPDGWQLGLLRWIKHERRIAAIIRDRISKQRPDIVNYNTARPLGEEALIEIHRHRIPLVALFHEAWLICPRITLLRSPGSEPCAGPAPIRCLECMYTYYDGSRAKALLKLPWRLIKLGIYPAYRLWRRKKARACLKAAMAYSQFMERAHRTHVPCRVKHIPLGIDLSGLRGQPKAHPNRPLRFGFVAGFQPHKGISDVLDAAVLLKEEGFDFELHIWGPHQEDSFQQIVARGLEGRAFLHGVYRPEQMWDVYSQMDVAIMATTVCEPFGRIPLEAAAAGVPTIAPAIGGITESIRDGVDGLLYQFRDKGHLKEQMRRLLQEPDLLRRLVENLQLPPDTESCVNAIEDFYYRALGLIH
jgi:glycosyltransferase involved in cell wall biosynthesis